MMPGELNNLVGANLDQAREIALQLAVLPLAKAIYANRLSAHVKASSSDLYTFIQELGQSHDYAFEVHLDKTDSDLTLIQHCIEHNQHRAAIVLLFTLLESEINAAVRIFLRIRGFSHGAISDALRGTDFATKFDVLLPVLGAQVPERTRQLALQVKVIRNMIVHDKAVPDLLTEDGTQPGTHEIVGEKARGFFILNPFSRIAQDIKKFVEDAVSCSPEVKEAKRIIEQLQG